MQAKKGEGILMEITLLKSLSMQEVWNVLQGRGRRARGGKHSLNKKDQHRSSVTTRANIKKNQVIEDASTNTIKDKQIMKSLCPCTIKSKCKHA